MSSSIWTRCAGASELRPLRLVAVARGRGAAPGVDAQARRLGRRADPARGVDRRREAARLDARPAALSARDALPLSAARARLAIRRPPRARHLVRIREPRDRVRRSRVLSLRLSRGHARRSRRRGDAAHGVHRRAHRSARAVDLVAPPFDAHRRAIASPSRYAATQTLGAAMRAAGVELFRYPSARDAERRERRRVHAERCSARREPRELETWQCTATRSRVEFATRDYFQVERRSRFLVRIFSSTACCRLRPCSPRSAGLRHRRDLCPQAAEQVERQWKHDRRVLFGADLDERL